MIKGKLRAIFRGRLNNLPEEWKGYCLNEKKSGMVISNPRKAMTRSGVPVVTGKCSSCGKRIYVLIDPRTSKPASYKAIIELAMSNSPKAERQLLPSKNGKYPCVCCGYLAIDRPAQYDICPICFWEDDDIQLTFVLSGGANHVSLIDAQKNFMSFGACESRVRNLVRQPSFEETKDPGWRPIDPGKDLQTTRDEDGKITTKLKDDVSPYYYWRNR
jgi:hypothetical protein